MSATRQSRAAARPPERVAPPVRDMAQLRVRRREARRRRRLLRVDLGVGVLCAIVLLLATPGLAIAAILALILISLCIGSVVLERRRSRKGRSRPGRGPGS
jgi:Flp pilus assembly protein TadB